jgi:uncharacterized protein (TIGR03000 family)
MFGRLLLGVGAGAVVSAILILAPETALAQHYVRGGEHHGSAGRAGTWPGGARASWADYRGDYGDPNRWGRGSRWGYAAWGWGYPYYGWGWSSPYYTWGTGLYGAYYPYYSSSLDAGHYYSMYEPVYDYGYFPNYGYRSSVTTVADDTAHIIVYLPDPDAEVWFDGQAISEPGTVRDFELPALAPIRDYVYEIRARWTEGGKTVDRTQRIHVQAGHEVTVNFTRSLPETLKHSK